MAFSWQRAWILSLIAKHEPVSIAELSRLAEVSAGTTIMRHLNELEDRGLITLTKTKENKKKKRGNPLIIKTTIKARALPLKTFEISDKIKNILK